MSLALCCLALGLGASEIVTLKTGFAIQAERHRAEGNQLVLDRIGGSISVPASEVDSIEQLPESAIQPPEALHTATIHVVDREEAQRLIAAASDAEGLPALFVLSVAHVESAFEATAVSNKGAVGLMQLMPATAQALGVSATEAGQNAMGGARYLRELLVRYGGDARLALAAYNAGPGAVDRFGGVPPFRETQLYVERVLREYSRRLDEERRSAPKRTAGRQPMASGKTR